MHTRYKFIKFVITYVKKAHALVGEEIWTESNELNWSFLNFALHNKTSYEYQCRSVHKLYRNYISLVSTINSAYECLSGCCRTMDWLRKMITHGRHKLIVGKCVFNRWYRSNQIWKWSKRALVLIWIQWGLVRWPLISPFWSYFFFSDSRISQYYFGEQN
jgi:hypothetical protein